MLYNAKIKNPNVYLLLLIYILYAFTISIIKLLQEFKNKIKEGYKTKLFQQKVLKMLVDKNNPSQYLLFKVYKRLIYYSAIDSLPIQLYILQSIIYLILEQAYNKSNYIGYSRIFNILIQQFYICRMSKILYSYLYYYFKCLLFQIYRYILYRQLILIISLPCSFYIITINFILVLLKLHLSLFDSIILITYKLFKKVALLLKKATYTAQDQSQSIVLRLLDLDQGIPKAIISN